MREKVEQAVDDIKMSKYLATIRTDVPIELSLEELQVKEPNGQELKQIFDELEFKRFTERFLNKSEKSIKSVNNNPSLFDEFQADGKEISKNSTLESLKTVEHNYQLIETQEEARKLCDFLLTNEKVTLTQRRLPPTPSTQNWWD